MPLLESIVRIRVWWLGLSDPHFQDTMSLFNMVNKVNPMTFFLMPLLGDKHPEQWPRFCDCFSTTHRFKEINGDPFTFPVDEKERPVNIHVMLRPSELDAELVRAHPSYLYDEHDPYDASYRYFVFSVPEEWKADYTLIVDGQVDSTSDRYKQRVLSMFPFLNEVKFWHSLNQNKNNGKI